MCSGGAEDLQKGPGELLPQAPEGISPADPLISDFRLPELGEKKSLWFKVTEPWPGVVGEQLRETRGES